MTRNQVRCYDSDESDYFWGYYKTREEAQKVISHYYNIILKQWKKRQNIS